MAIVCDKCRVEIVFNNGETCQKCLDIEAESKIDRSYQNEVYLPPDLFEKFKKLHDKLDSTKPETLKAVGVFVKALGTSFINKFTGKEINDPTPQVIIPKERTLDRIQKILNHNLSVYARENDMDTPDDLDDWNVTDMYSDEWEQSLYQYVDNIILMDDDVKVDNLKVKTENPEVEPDKQLTLPDK